MQFHFQSSDAIQVVFALGEDQDHPFFRGKKGEVFPDLGQNQLYLGLGKEKDFNLESFKEAVYSLGKDLAQRQITALAIPECDLDLDPVDYVLAIAEALIVSGYQFDKYKKDSKAHALKDIYLPAAYSDQEDKLDELVRVLDGQFLARDLTNTRSKEMTPELIAESAKQALEGSGVTVKVYEEKEIEDLGLTAFLAVARGSKHRPRFIVMEYMQGGDQKPLALVGKGVAYDSGGYSLKPSDAMNTMHCDMAGSATVIGAMKAIAGNQLKANVVGIVATCENAVDGGAYKPGDVVTARNGMTIEIDNTDAEGRVTLADAVNYAATEYDPAMIIDIATLTGAILIALGETYTGVVTNDAQAFDQVQAAADQSHEKIWQLPNDSHLRTFNQSDVADVKNSGGRLGGSITAGQFIENFVEGKPWVHLDVAGTAYLSKEQGINGKGATGVHVKTFYNLAKAQAN